MNLHVISAKQIPFVVPVTNGFMVTPHPGMTLIEATLIRQGIVPERWLRQQPRFIDFNNIAKYLEEHEVMAFPVGWSADKFKMTDELSVAFADFTNRHRSELCCAHYARKAGSLVKAAHRPEKEPGVRLEPKFTELFIQHLEATYGVEADAVVTVIRRDGIASAITPLRQKGWESYEDWKARVVGPKRNDPFKAMAVRLLARRR